MQHLPEDEDNTSLGIRIHGQGGGRLTEEEEEEDGADFGQRKGDSGDGDDVSQWILINENLLFSGGDSSGTGPPPMENRGFPTIPTQNEDPSSLMISCSSSSSSTSNLPFDKDSHHFQLQQEENNNNNDNKAPYQPLAGEATFGNGNETGKYNVNYSAGGRMKQDDYYYSSYDHYGQNASTSSSFSSSPTTPSFNETKNKRKRFDAEDFELKEEEGGVNANGNVEKKEGKSKSSYQDLRKMEVAISKLENENKELLGKCDHYFHQELESSFLDQIEHFELFQLV